MTGAVVVGIGQRVVGDDAIGLAVARAVAARGLEVRESSDASCLLELVAAGRRVVLVDAVVGGGQPGTVLRLDPGALAAGPAPLSSHGIGVAEALALARTLYGEPVVAIVGIAIDRPREVALAMSPAVAAAIEPAAALVVTLAAALANATVSAMHESSLAKKLVELVVAAAGGATVRVVRGRVAETETLSRDALELHFRAYARGTPAAEARLEVALVHVEARCRACGATYRPEHHVLLCDRCGSSDGEELAATGLWLEAIECDTPEGGA
jgi:hydrogenase nickel incorporation protein HypA/HybF